MRGLTRSALTAAMLLVVQGAAITFAQSTIHVPADWPTIQDALDQARDDDVIVVAAGTWREHLVFPPRAVHLRSADGPELCTIDASDTVGSVVVFSTGCTADSILEGFTLVGGVASYGGGVRCDVGAEATIRGNHIVGNRALRAGGGIHARPGNVLTVVGNLIAFNESAGEGGGLDAPAAGSVIRNNVFAGNVAFEGAGVFVQAGTSVDLVNDTFFANVASRGEAVAAKGDVAVTNCIVWSTFSQPFKATGGGSITVTYSDVEGSTGQPWAGVGCLDADPLFVDPSVNDYHLMPFSPCVGAGNDAVVPPGALDWDGEPRILHGHVDLGVDEVVYLLGTQEDFGLGVLLDGIVPLRRTFDFVGETDLIDVTMASPTGTFIGSIPVLAAQAHSNASPPRPPAAFPGVHIDPSAAFVIFDGLAPPGPLGTMLLPTQGITLQFRVPSGLAGTIVRLQAFAVSFEAGNGIFAASDGHDLEVR